MTLLLLDTGPLVAYLNRRDEHHEWARSVMDEVPPPLRTCEAVLSEASFLLRRSAGGPEAVLEMVVRGAVSIGFRLEIEIGAVRRLLGKYADVPMSLADACLVRMTELDRDTAVLTCDRDFSIYRRNRRQVVPVRRPPGLG